MVLFCWLGVVLWGSRSSNEVKLASGSKLGGILHNDFLDGHACQLLGELVHLFAARHEVEHIVFRDGLPGERTHRAPTVEQREGVANGYAWCTL